MPDTSQNSPPEDAPKRRAATPLVCYSVDQLPVCDMELYGKARQDMTKVSELKIAPRDGATFEVPAGHFFRIVSVEGPQVGDLNLWNANDLFERFFSGKTRQLHATHVSTGDRLWSSLPGLRPMATITHDTLDWYGWDDDGSGVHDVIGTRCDPYTNFMLKGVDYHYCCHSNLTRALAAAKDMPLERAEPLIHDVMNVFMCTGFTLDTHQYFMKASPVRPGDFIEFFAEIDLLGALSTCPGGDCGSSHSDDATTCYPLLVEIFKPADGSLAGWESPARSGYCGGHGL
ncbi:MAG: urea carboxylase-associated family protein [Gammaproteobacteria bacterium]